jgi:hypothetical protein
VANHDCIDCRKGTQNTAGDSRAGEDTVCYSILCGENQVVVNNECVYCAIFSGRAAGANAGGPDSVSLGPDEMCHLPTTCNNKIDDAKCANMVLKQGKLCDMQDETGEWMRKYCQVRCNTCVSVESPKSLGTCANDQRVKTHACVQCPFGQNGAAYQPMSGPDTQCVLPLCKGVPDGARCKVLRTMGFMCTDKGDTGITLKRECPLGCNTCV